MGYETHAIRGVSQRYGRRELGGESGVQKDSTGAIVVKINHKHDEAGYGEPITIPAVLGECRVESVEFKVNTAFDGALAKLDVKVGGSSLFATPAGDLTATDTVYDTSQSPDQNLQAAAGDTITVEPTVASTVGDVDVVVRLVQV